MGEAGCWGPQALAGDSGGSASGPRTTASLSPVPSPADPHAAARGGPGTRVRAADPSDPGQRCLAPRGPAGEREPPSPPGTAGDGRGEAAPRALFSHTHTYLLRNIEYLLRNKSRVGK